LVIGFHSTVKLSHLTSEKPGILSKGYGPDITLGRSTSQKTKPRTQKKTLLQGYTKISYIFWNPKSRLTMTYNYKLYLDTT